MCWRTMHLHEMTMNCSKYASALKIQWDKRKFDTNTRVPAHLLSLHDSVRIFANSCKRRPENLIYRSWNGQSIGHLFLSNFRMIL